MEEDEKEREGSDRYIIWKCFWRQVQRVKRVLLLFGRPSCFLFRFQDNLFYSLSHTTRKPLDKESLEALETPNTPQAHMLC